MTLAFIARELWTKKPFLNLRLLVRESLPYLMLLLAGYRFIILSTAYIIPTYLQTVQNFRELQVGAVLLWIALPQFLIVYPLAALLKRIDGRWVLAFGTAIIGVACIMAADSDQPVGHRGFPAVADHAGDRSVLRVDRADRADRAVDQPGRCA